MQYDFIKELKQNEAWQAYSEKYNLLAESMLEAGLNLEMLTEVIESLEAFFRPGQA